MATATASMNQRGGDAIYRLADQHPEEISPPQGMYNQPEEEEVGRRLVNMIGRGRGEVQGDKK